MKKTLKPKKLTLDTSTLRVLTTSNLRDIVGGTTGGCTGASACHQCAGTNNSCGNCYEN